LFAHCGRHYRRVSEERRNALELASRQQWMLMELEHERRKERERSQHDEAQRAREMDEHVRHVEEVKREKVRTCLFPAFRLFAAVDKVAIFRR
jgi:hypothetical protein